MIAEYAKSVAYYLWKKDRETISAVVRNIEIIRESATKVPKNIQEQCAVENSAGSSPSLRIKINKLFAVMNSNL